MKKKSRLDVEIAMGQITHGKATAEDETLIEMIKAG